jgi:hypothetical protein
MHRYQVALLGRQPAVAAGLSDRIHHTATELGLDHTHLRLLDEEEVEARDRKSPAVAVFFGYPGASDRDHPAVASLHDDSLPIIPAVPTLDGFRSQVPETIGGVNGLRLAGEEDLERLVTAIFENLHLLRLERRLFISYRRAESTPIAMQLYEALDARGFDVFLDTRSVPPAVDVQAELWHRLADSDVVVLLDTPHFRVSDWTVQELAQANATSIQILHLLWPGVLADRASAFSDFYPLQLADFRFGRIPDSTSVLSDECVAAVCARAESLRARALASRYAYLVDNLCDLAIAHGLDVAVHPERFVSFQSGGDTHAIFPAVGVPTALRLEEFEQAVRHIDPAPVVRVIYDERGILDRWKMHLGWLSSHLPVKALQVSRLPEAFAAGDI